MTKKSKKKEIVSNSTVRNTGLIVAAVLGAYELLSLGRTYGYLHSKLMLIVLVLTITSLLFPVLLRPLYHGWMKLGYGMGFVMSRLILGVLFYFVVMPVSLVQRMIGSIEIKKHFDKDAKSYRINRSPVSAKHLENWDELSLEELS